MIVTCNSFFVGILYTVQCLWETEVEFVSAGKFIGYSTFFAQSNLSEMLARTWLNSFTVVAFHGYSTQNSTKHMICPYLHRIWREPHAIFHFASNRKSHTFILLKRTNADSPSHSQSKFLACIHSVVAFWAIFPENEWKPCAHRVTKADTCLQYTMSVCVSKTGGAPICVLYNNDVVNVAVSSLRWKNSDERHVMNVKCVWPFRGNILRGNTFQRMTSHGKWNVL